MKIIKIYLFHMIITLIMKIIEFPYENHETTKNQRITVENNENHENHGIPHGNHENHENHRIP